MQRYKATIAYDGAQFSGYQTQLNGRTVQDEVEKVLSNMHKTATVITGSGRTDAGVHASGQVIHFDSELSLPRERWLRALNGLLPADIAVLDIKAVPSSFHARFDAIGKTYQYKVYRGAVRNPFLRNYTAHYPHPIDIDNMRKAAAFLTGTHDFTSFCSAKAEVKNKVRTVHEIAITEKDDTLILSVSGNGFLYNMVRILAGTLLEVGNGKISIKQVREILLEKDRTLAGKTAPAEGLYLWKVDYPNEENKKKDNNFARCAKNS